MAKFWDGIEKESIARGFLRCEYAWAGLSWQLNSFIEDLQE